MATPSFCAARTWPCGSGLPPTATVPPSGRSCPDTIFISVDLPAPFSPARAVTVPGARSSDTPLSTGTPPNAFVRSRHSTAAAVGSVIAVTRRPVVVEGAGHPVPVDR